MPQLFEWCYLFDTMAFWQSPFGLILSHREPATRCLYASQAQYESVQTLDLLDISPSLPS